MGIRDWLARRKAEYDENDYYYKLGCEVMGPQQSYTSVSQRAARLAAGRREHARREAAEQARRQQLEGRWMSQYRSTTGKIDVLVDKSGNPTDTYPHVHIAYNEQEDRVHVILSLGPRNHPNREVLPGDATGNQVSEAVLRMRQLLP